MTTQARIQTGHGAAINRLTKAIAKAEKAGNIERADRLRTGLDNLKNITPTVWG